MIKTTEMYVDTVYDQNDANASDMSEQSWTENITVEGSFRLDAGVNTEMLTDRTDLTGYAVAMAFGNCAGFDARSITVHNITNEPDKSGKPWIIVHFGISLPRGRFASEQSLEDKLRRKIDEALHKYFEDALTVIEPTNNGWHIQKARLDELKVHIPMLDYVSYENFGLRKLPPPAPLAVQNRFIPNASRHQSEARQ